MELYEENAFIRIFEIDLIYGRGTMIRAIFRLGNEGDLLAKVQQFPRLYAR